MGFSRLSNKHLYLLSLLLAASNPIGSILTLKAYITKDAWQDIFCKEADLMCSPLHFPFQTEHIVQDSPEDPRALSWKFLTHLSPVRQTSSSLLSLSICHRL